MNKNRLLMEYFDKTYSVEDSWLFRGELDSKTLDEVSELVMELVHFELGLDKKRQFSVIDPHC